MIGLPAGSVSVTITVHVEIGYGIARVNGLPHVMIVDVERPLTVIPDGELVLPL